MTKKNIKDKVCKAIEKMVISTFGRSIPPNFHEPKIPECLKKK